MTFVECAREAHYFNGHQHDLEHIVENNTKVNYISTGAHTAVETEDNLCRVTKCFGVGTGAGKFCCYDFSNLDTVPRGSIKFAMSGPHGTQWEPMPFEILSGFTSYRIGSEFMQVYCAYATPLKLRCRTSAVGFCLMYGRMCVLLHALQSMLTTVVCCTRHHRFSHARRRRSQCLVLLGPFARRPLVVQAVSITHTHLRSSKIRTQGGIRVCVTSRVRVVRVARDVRSVQNYKNIKSYIRYIVFALLGAYSLRNRLVHIRIRHAGIIHRDPANAAWLVRYYCHNSHASFCELGRPLHNSICLLYGVQMRGC